MITPAEHPLTFIRNITSDPKIKYKVTPEELDRFLAQLGSVRNMHDKGLIAVVASELINYQFTAFIVRLKAVHGQICRVHKPERKRREGGDRLPPKRNRRNRGNNNNVDLQQIASQSISNPSHIQGAQDQARERDESKGSKGSNPSNPPVQEPNIDFNAQIDNLGPIDIDPMEMGHEIIHPDSSQNSSQSASSKGSSLIPNLTEKLRILGGDVSFTFDKRTVPRVRGEGRAARPTVKRKGNLVDDSTILDQTMDVTIDPRRLPEPFLREKRQFLETRVQEEQTEQIIERKIRDVSEKLFDPQNLRKLKQITGNRRRYEEEPQMHQPSYDYETGQQIFSQEFMIPSTSMIPGNPEDSEFNKSLQQDLNSGFLRGEKKMTLTNLHELTKRPKEDLFMKILWGASRGDVTLEQTSPSTFGEITMTKTSA